MLGFDEIQLPVHSAEGGWFPGMKLDYRRFFSDNFNNLLSMEAGILRQYIGKEIFLYTNWPGANWSVNCFDGAQYLDYAAWDNYVPMPYGEKYRETLRSCMEHDFDRRLSCGKNRFLIAEQSSQPNAGNIPEAVHAQTWLDVAHGAFGTIFFEWRTPTGGAEQQYVSVLGFDKEYGESEHVMRKLSKDINKVYPLIDGADTVSEIATLYSYQNSWATPGWVVDGPYDQDFFNIHIGFKNALQTNLDVVGIQDDFSEYKMIVAPNLTLITEEDAQKVISYVENGGTLRATKDDDVVNIPIVDSVHLISGGIGAFNAGGTTMKNLKGLGGKAFDDESYQIAVPPLTNISTARARAVNINSKNTADHDYS